MSNKKMSLTQSSKSHIKHPLDGMIQADYVLLKNHQHPPSIIQNGQLSNRNSLLKRDILNLQEYQIPHTHKRMEEDNLYFKRLDVSRRKSANKKQGNLSDNKSHKKLNVMSRWKINQQPRRAIQIQAQKKATDPKNEKNHQNCCSSPFICKGICPEPTPRLNINQQFSLFETPQKQLDFSIMNNNQPYFSSCKRITVSRQQNELLTTKKKPIYQEIQDSKQQNSKHTFPLRKSQTLLNPAEQNIIKDSYRYCPGCESPIIIANIRQHEQICQSFKQLSALSNQELLKQLKQKIAQIQSRIPLKNQQLAPEHSEHIRAQSLTLIKETKNRRKNSPESHAFKQNYNGIMQIGKKWCLALEQVNKLRWFSRIVNKLEENNS